MSHFDTVAVIDWSGGNDTGPRPRKDAIWMGVTREGVDEAPVYIRNRMEAEWLVAGLIEQELAARRRLFVGFDFPFGFPAGFAEGLTWPSTSALVMLRSPRQYCGLNVRVSLRQHLTGPFISPRKGEAWRRRQSDAIRLFSLSFSRSG